MNDQEIFENTAAEFSRFTLEDDAYDSLAKREAELIELNKAIDLESESLLKEEVHDESSSLKSSKLNAKEKRDVLEEQTALAQNEIEIPSKHHKRTNNSGARASRIPRGGPTGKQRPSSIPRKAGAGGKGARQVATSLRQEKGNTESLPQPPLGGEDDDEEEPSSLGPEGTIRFQRARIKVLEAQLKELHERCQELEKEANTAKSETRSHLEEKKKLSKELQNASLAAKKQAKLQEKVETTTGGLQQQLSVAREELRAANKSNKELEDRNKKLELRLNRALDDVDKHKTALQQVKSDVRDNSSQQVQSNRELEARCQRLERQKTELLNAFRKQMRLIDVLKRQKVHIEAAKLLSFTEEEFMKILDWGS